eukprot:3933575-Rhodomonas_salina.5
MEQGCRERGDSDLRHATSTAACDGVSSKSWAIGMGTEGGFGVCEALTAHALVAPYASSVLDIALADAA